MTRIRRGALTTRGHFELTIFSQFECQYIISFWTSLDRHRLSISHRRWDNWLQSYQGRPWPMAVDQWRSVGVHRKLYLKAYINKYMVSYFTSIVEHHFSISHRFEIPCFKGFDPWLLKVTQGPKRFGNRNPIYDFLFDFYRHHLSISHRFWTNDIRGFERRVKYMFCKPFCIYMHGLWLSKTYLVHIDYNISTLVLYISVLPDQVMISQSSE